MSNATDAQGTTIAVGDGASPEVFAVIAGISDLSEIPQEHVEIEKTDIADTREQFFQGIGIASEVTFSGNLDSANVSQDKVRASKIADTALNYKITLTDSPATVLTFSARVTRTAHSGPAKDKLMFHFTLKLTTDVTAST